MFKHHIIKKHILTQNKTHIIKTGTLSRAQYNGWSVDNVCSNTGFVHSTFWMAGHFVLLSVNLKKNLIPS